MKILSAAISAAGHLPLYGLNRGVSEIWLLQMLSIYEAVDGFEWQRACSHHVERQRPPAFNMTQVTARSRILLP